MIGFVLLTLGSEVPPNDLYHAAWQRLVHSQKYVYWGTLHWIKVIKMSRQEKWNSILGSYASLHSSRNKFDKYSTQLSIIPFTHCATSTMTPIGNSSLLHFLRKLQSMSLVVIHVATSLMHLMMIPRNPLSMPYVFFISSTSAFSFFLLSRYYAGFSPWDERPVI